MPIENGKFVPAGSETTRFLLLFFGCYRIALQSWMAMYEKDFF